MDVGRGRLVTSGFAVYGSQFVGIELAVSERRRLSRSQAVNRRLGSTHCELQTADRKPACPLTRRQRVEDRSQRVGVGPDVERLSLHALRRENRKRDRIGVGFVVLSKLIERLPLATSLYSDQGWLPLDASPRARSPAQLDPGR